MTSRRPHPKTKLGCTQCKRRRIKCDEGRPLCNHCQKHGIDCSFAVFDPSPRPSGLLSSTTEHVLLHTHVFARDPNVQSDSSLRQYVLDLNVQNMLLEQFGPPDRQRYLNILQHFFHHSIPLLHAASAVQAAWRNSLQVIARSHKFVTHGILAIGALHLAQASTTEQDRNIYEDISATQMNAGMAQYRLKVQNATKDIAEALLAFSTMFTLYVLRTAGNECDVTLAAMNMNKTSHQDPAISIQTLSLSTRRIFRSTRGVLVIIVPFWDHIQSGLLRPVLDREWWPPPIPITPEQIEEDQRLWELHKMWSRPERSYEYSFDTLRHALKSLRETFALVSRLISPSKCWETERGISFDWGSLFTWPVQLSLEFLKLLDQHCAEAWVLIAHYALLINKAKGVLWLDGLPSNLVSTAALVIGQESWSWIAWPAKAVNVNLETLRDFASIPLQASTQERETS